MNKIVNLGPTCSGTNCSLYLAATTPDYSGNNDIALLYLSEHPPIQPTLTIIGNLVESGVPPPAAPPHAGQAVATWGWGCNVYGSPYCSGGGEKRFKNWSYVLPGTDHWIHHARTVALGDSGGPAITGTWIWGVNSGTGGQASDPREIYGSVTYYYGQMCSAMNGFPHSPCRTGAALSSLPSSCAPIATSSLGPWPRRHIVSHICEPNYMGQAPIDSYCCTNEWDDYCVQEAQGSMSVADWNACLAGP